MTRFTTLLAAASLLALSACSKLTTENYDQLKVGMPYEEVTALFGPPDTCSEVMGMKHCQWGDDTRGVSISFAGNQVLLYSGRNLR